ncbi:MAG: DUF4373 domain-containing protein [Clostridiaceae bacterium]
MARPLKLGLDYFPLDVAFDDNIELVEAEFGLEGFAILIKVWQKIYANGYFLNWNDDTALLFAKKINTEKTKITSVINACLLRSIFDKVLYERFGVLTSRGIQKRYIIACASSKRKNITMEAKYLLIEDRYKQLITEIIPFTQEETAINSGESTQRKGKETERKGKESIKDYSLEFEKFRQRYDAETLEKIDRYFEILRTTRVSGKISDSIKCQVYDEMNKHPPIIVKCSCETVIKRPDLHSKKENYFYGIMRNTTADEAEHKLNSKQETKSKYRDMTNYKPGEG